MAEKEPAHDQRRRTRPLTRQSLEESALGYLERYASSSQQLRGYLLRKIRQAEDADPAARSWVGEVVTKLEGLGLLDDQRYATSRAASLHRSGKSSRAIAATLRARSVEGEVIGQALEALREEAPDPELVAACTLARKRRLGPYCDPRTRKDRRMKDLAVLGRAGFAYELARRVVDAPTVEELEALVSVAEGKTPGE